MKTALIGFLTIICLAGLFGQAWGAAYYVDPDCTNGLTTYNPSTHACTGGSDTVYSTLTNLNTAVTGDQSDNTVYIRKGKTYTTGCTTAGNGTAGHPYTFTTFGTGANPVIEGADTVTGWTYPVDGHPHLASVTNTTDTTKQFFENGTVLKFIEWTTDLATTLAAMESYGPGCAAHDATSTPHKSYVYPVDPANLTANMKISKRIAGINNANKTYVEYYNIDVQNHYYNAVSFTGISTGCVYSGGTVTGAGNVGIYNAGSVVSIVDAHVTYSQEDGIEATTGGTINAYSCTSAYNGGVNGTVAKGDGWTTHNDGVINMYACVGGPGNTKSGRMDASTSGANTIWQCTFAGNLNLGLSINSGATYDVAWTTVDNTTGSSYAVSIVNAKYTGDYNNFYGTISKPYLVGASACNWTEYLAANGSQDTHSLHENPYLTSDLKPTASSPDNNLGSAATLCGVVADLNDPDGNAICSSGSWAGRGWDIGWQAYNYGAAVPVKWFVDLTSGSSSNTGTVASSARDTDTGLNGRVAGDMILFKNSSGGWPTRGAYAN